MTRFLGVSCGVSYFLRPDLGKMLEVEEGDPELIHAALIRMLQKTYFALDQEAIKWKVPVQGMIQMNTRDFAFQDIELRDNIHKLYSATSNLPNLHDRVKPSMHQNNDAQPLPEKKFFFNEIIQNASVARLWNSPHITVHMPVRKENDTNVVIETLLQPIVVQAILGNTLQGENPISIDLENNHHGSYFGHLGNFGAFIDEFDDKINELGLSELKSCINICFDFGHFISQAHKEGYPKREMLAEFFTNYGDRIKTLHLHVNDGKWDDHFLFSHRPGPDTKIGSVLNDINLLNEHRTIILEHLSLLNLPQRDDWVIISETETPFSLEMLAEHFRLINAAI